MRRKKKTDVVDPSELKDAIERNTIGQGEAPVVPPATPATPPPPKKKTPKPNRVETILVRHDFTTEENANLGKLLADKERMAEDIEGEMKACARQYKDKLASARTEISSTVNKLKEGFEMIPVEAVVMVKIDRKAKTAKKCYYRKDTGEFIKDEKAINVELELFNVLPDNRDETKPLPAKLIASQV